MADEVIELKGHLIDSLILPRVLDEIMARGGLFEILQIQVGARPQDSSFARIRISHPRPRVLEVILKAVKLHGAEPVEREEVQTKKAPRDGVFPEGFYATTNLDTSIYLDGRWVRVQDPEMDSGILVSLPRHTARTVKMADVRKGDAIVAGDRGVHVIPIESVRAPRDFAFMSSDVSTEKPKGVLIANVARLMEEERKAQRPILWVLGPAVVHTGAAPLMEKLIAAGYAQILFAGNALAAHDIESALLGTSLGISMREGVPTQSGHENHLRTINAIRQAGGIRAAVRKGLLKRGIMCACVKHHVKFLLAGSIRDDGPLPDVITNTLEAQRAMRALCRPAKLAILVATLLHSVATGNMLPALTRVVAVDIQPAAVTKLVDRGSFQTIGIVTDVQPFFSELLSELGLV